MEVLLADPPPEGDPAYLAMLQGLHHVLEGRERLEVDLQARLVHEEALRRQLQRDHRLLDVEALVVVVRPSDCVRSVVGWIRRASGSVLEVTGASA